MFEIPPGLLTFEQQTRVDEARAVLASRIGRIAPAQDVMREEHVDVAHRLMTIHEVRENMPGAEDALQQVFDVVTECLDSKDQSLPGVIALRGRIATFREAMRGFFQASRDEVEALETRLKRRQA